MATPIIKNRNVPGDQIRDPSIIENLQYNESAGAKKSLTVGPRLIPLGDGAGGYTTDASTARVLPSAGLCLAIYNKSAATDYSVTIGDSTVAAQAIGAVQVSSGNVFVGVPCPKSAWTYISCGPNKYVVTNNNNLAVFIIDDASYIVVQSQNNAST
jgi:hypothetical protein